MSEKAIIFLDYDGVITSTRAMGFRELDIYTVTWIRWICEETGAKIVISSTWRFGWPERFFRATWGEYLHADWRTAEVGTTHRGEQVNEWLTRHAPDKYLILDDDNDFYDFQKPFLIQTDSQDGMLTKHLLAVREYFGIEKFPHSVDIFDSPEMHQTMKWWAENRDKGDRMTGIQERAREFLVRRHDQPVTGDHCEQMESIADECVDLPSKKRSAHSPPLSLWWRG